MNNVIKSPRGTRDILPDEAIKWSNLEMIARAIFTQLNYQEIRTPIFEETTLFRRGIGEGTDIVSKEMYNFIDQGKRELTLRPEGTAGVVRSFIQNQLDKNKLINRLWYCGPMFRYERPQGGRQRQFHQLGVECLGTNNAYSDFEVISLACNFLNALDLNNFKLEINSIGDFNDRQQYIALLKDFLNNYKDDLDQDSLDKLSTNPLRILDTKNTKTREILKEAPILSDFLSYQSQQHFESLCEYLSFANIDYDINSQLVRGLDYYTYTAFEIKNSNLGSQDTICGGGRYNSLVKQLKGPDIPAVGWGMGLERLLLLLENQQSSKAQALDFYLITLGQNLDCSMIQLGDILKKSGFTCEFDITSSRIQKKIKRANQLNAFGCIIVGEEELKREEITIKWLSSGRQVNVALNDLHILKRLYLEENLYLFNSV
uniref:histidine-tRNA synthetase n=1 Tax=Erythrolobus coxiae TaxID=362235 RepID=UPI001FCCC2F9|nr:histidine-tRNA synthetase [Erythrolobus coxiae]UNJ17655.1 histidine-tRNA synthetase [Erythrolobus coxiae]